jgi:cytochrome c peroxidase
MLIRKTVLFFAVTIFIVVLLLCCSTQQQNENLLQQSIPSYIKDTVYLQSDNVFTNEKAELGRYLFYDRRLSVNNTKACAGCHAQQFSFTDNYVRSIGALGDLHQRNAKPLVNIVFNKYLTAADSTLHYPEEQINKPMFNEHPVEMGWKGNEAIILNRLREDDLYKKLFAEAFPENAEDVTVKNVQQSITSFVKTIFSFNSAYDKYYYQKEERALTASQQNGMALFFSDRLKCSLCHGGINFNKPIAGDYFNTGLYNLEGKGFYPSYDMGLYEKTKNETDIGKYKVPTLRNLAFTAPYFHDGSAQSLTGVIDVYENGGRGEEGKQNPYKSNFITGFKLTSQERGDLVEFLLSLSDSSVLINPRYANPFSEDETNAKNK